MPGFHGALDRAPGRSAGGSSSSTTPTRQRAWIPKAHPRDTDPKPARDGIFYPRAVGHRRLHRAQRDDHHRRPGLRLGGPRGLRRGRHLAGRRDARLLPAPRAQRVQLPLPAPAADSWWWRQRATSSSGWFGCAPDSSRGQARIRRLAAHERHRLSLGLQRPAADQACSAARSWQSRRARLDRALDTRGRAVPAGAGAHAISIRTTPRRRREAPKVSSLIPLAVCGERTTIHQNSADAVRDARPPLEPARVAARDAGEASRRLVIWTEALVTGCCSSATGRRRRAPIGVEFLQGRQRLYGATKRQNADAAAADARRPCLREGGRRGDALRRRVQHAAAADALGHRRRRAPAAGGRRRRRGTGCTLRGRDGTPLPTTTARRAASTLPGVGRNLQDRYEVTLISEMKRGFLVPRRRHVRSAGTVGPPTASEGVAAEGTGLYTSNGAVLGIFKRSQPRPRSARPVHLRAAAAVSTATSSATRTSAASTTSSHGRSSRGTRTTPTARCTLRSHRSARHARASTSTTSTSVVRATGESDDDPDLLALVDGVKFVRGICAADAAIRSVRRPSHRERAASGLAQVPPDDDQAITDWIRRERVGPSRLRHMPHGARRRRRRGARHAASACAASRACASSTRRSSRRSPATSSSPTSTWRARRRPTCCSRTPPTGAPTPAVYPLELRGKRSARRSRSGAPASG